MPQEAAGLRETLTAIGFMTAGMAAAASVDAVIKAASGSVAPGLIVVVIGFGMVAVFAIVSALGRVRPLSRAALHPAALARTLCEVVGAVSIVLALSLVSLSLVTAIAQTVPILATLGAVIFFGERVRPVDWVSLGVGLVGMLLIVRPGGAAFDPAILLAVLAATGLAGRDLLSRAVPRHISTAELGVMGGLALGGAGIVMMLLRAESLPTMSPPIALSFAAIVVFAALTFFCVTTAMRIGRVATVSPFRYSRLVFGVALGAIFFGERLDAMSVAGAALIVVSGVVLLRRAAG